MHTASSIARDISSLIRPPERLRVSEAATRSLKVKAKSGGVDDWSPELVPYMIEPMDCLSMREYEILIFAGPAQSGKTASILFGGITHGVTCENADMMIVQTTKKTADEFESLDLSWTIRHSPDMKERMAKGSRADNVYMKTFKAGNKLILAWPTVEALSGKALKTVILTDADRMDAITGEGSILKLAKERTKTYLSRGMVAMESSPSGELLDPQWRPSEQNPHEAPPSDSKTLTAFNDGDRRRWYVECPECHEYFMPPCDISGLVFNINHDLLGTTDSLLTSPAKYLCTANGCLIDTDHKKAMNATGKWLKEGQSIKHGKICGEGRQSKIASFWFPGVFAAYANPQSIAQSYLDALRTYDIKGDESDLQTITNTNIAAPYLPQRKISEYSTADYKKRAEPGLEKHVPAGVRFLIAVADVQGHFFSVAVIGYGENLERWLIDRFEIRVSDRKENGQLLTIKPNVHQEDWQKLKTDVMQKTYPLADGSRRHMRVLVTGSDSNGEPGVTDRAYKFWRELRKEKLQQSFYLLKGETPNPKTNRPNIRKSYPEAIPNKTNNTDVPIWILNTTKLKDTLSADLKKEQHAPRYIHFPDWLPEAIYAELSAESRDDKGWTKISKRNELFDQLCYADAVYLAKLQESKIKGEINWAAPPIWARPWDDNPNVTAQENNPTKEEKPVIQTVKPTEPKQVDWLGSQNNNFTQGNWL